ncbi:Ribosomal_protein S5 [Hexamita inflata]|uniref:Small ribosomal subunit protein uS5 n=1 Tax=Hexamita inflata TaxID=28002 RepID=A0AA86NU63_9EUKA|nr:Ribosomal protein S5 [Hexamita inflata]CAI9928756.1 Ribosomal protein S5 [Hexamita inflata]
MSAEQKPQQKGERGPRVIQEVEWKPTTKLGRLVKSGQITSLNEIFKYSLAIKEVEIVDKFIKLEERVVKVASVQKQTAAGQRTRFRAHVVVGDRKQYLGFGCGASKEVAIAVKKAVAQAKMNLIPIRLGFWGGKLGQPHTIAQKCSGKCGSVKFRLIPAPRGTGIVAATKVQEAIILAGITDVFTRQFGHTRTLMNSVGAFYDALKSSYRFLTPDLWAQQEFGEDVRNLE